MDPKYKMKIIRENKRLNGLKQYNVWLPSNLLDELKYKNETIDDFFLRVLNFFKQNQEVNQHDQNELIVLKGLIEENNKKINDLMLFVNYQNDVNQNDVNQNDVNQNDVNQNDVNQNYYLEVQEFISSKIYFFQHHDIDQEKLFIYLFVYYSFNKAKKTKKEIAFLLTSLKQKKYTSQSIENIMRSNLYKQFVF